LLEGPPREVEAKNLTTEDTETQRGSKGWKFIPPQAVRWNSTSGRVFKGWKREKSLTADGADERGWE